MAPSDAIEVSFLNSDGESTVVGTVRRDWRKSVDSAQRVCICRLQTANRA